VIKIFRDVEALLNSRRQLLTSLYLNNSFPARKLEAEGGCGVIGTAHTIPVEGRHFYKPLHQMKNRGNGKGGGIAAFGLSPSYLGVSRSVLTKDYIIQIAYLKPDVMEKVESQFILSFFDIDFQEEVEDLGNYRKIGLEVRPPKVKRYFVRPKDEELKRFIEKHLGLENLRREKIEDEYISQKVFVINSKFYETAGEKQAFVLSYGKNMIIFKIVGYGDKVIEYYKLEDMPAHLWIGHHRYPTKGKIWHPAGSHPFAAANVALIHNGDYANYASIVEYLKQRGFRPLFHTDTEVAVLAYDLWRRVYNLPLEYVIEAMAPTSERDFYMLRPEKRAIYQTIQAVTIHGSPDGPWFHIIGESDYQNAQHHLSGVTDTSMLRPQVFALQEGSEKFGVIASEKQAIDAFFRSLYEDGIAPAPIPDVYWVARGGSHTDGGAFIFTLKENCRKPHLMTTNKFGEILRMEQGQYHWKVRIRRNQA